MMKRLLLTALVIAVLAAPAYAQGSNGLGIKGGVNMFKPYGDDVQEASYLTSFAIGAFYYYELSEIFVLQPELYYSVKGGVEEEEDGDSELKLSYIDIPVLFKAKLPIEGKCWAPLIYAGPYLAFLAAADVDGNDVKDFMKSTDFGLVVGAGADINLNDGAHVLNLDFRYSMGFTKIYEPDDDGQEIEAFNNGFQFLAGFGFSL